MTSPYISDPEILVIWDRALKKLYLCQDVGGLIDECHQHLNELLVSCRHYLPVIELVKHKEIFYTVLYNPEA